MGLPLFITPVESEATTKAKDSIASSPRTSIRRQRTARTSHARLLDGSRRRQALRMFENDGQIGREPSRLSRSPPDVEEMLRGYADYELSRAFGRTPPPNEPEGRNSLSARMRRFAQERQRRENDALGPRDTPSFERPQGPGEPDGPLMPPAPEPRDFGGIGERQRVRDLRRMARRHGVLTPPTAENDVTPMEISDGPQPSEGNTALFDRRVESRRQPEVAIGASEPFMLPSDDDDIRRHGEMQPSNDPEISRRLHSRRPWSNIIERESAVRRRNRARIDARIDGLGDRDRSMSPSYPEQEDTWDTLLTSITPDPQPPSAGSSFASSSAAAAASSSTSIPQSMTSSMTSVDRTDEDPTNHDCDISDSGSGSDWEEPDEMPVLGPRMARGERFWRTYADVVTARADGATRRTGGGDTEHLGGMQRIITRLVERDDIPDEWWAGAGLIRREPSS